MSLNSDKIALVEIGGSHDECLLSQMHAVKSEGKEILLICTKDMAERNPAFKEYIDEFFIVDIIGNKKKAVKEIWRELKKHNVSKVIFNTAQGSLIRNLCLKALFSKIEFIGVIHTTRKFQGSFTQKIINWKIKKYIVLSEYLLSTITPPKGIKVDYFYPLRYAEFNQQPTKKENLIVSIIGGVENRRKDLTGFVELIKTVKNEPISFIFLGKSDKNGPEVVDFVNLLKKEGLENRVTLFDSFVSQEVFDLHLKQTDLILPLVHPDTPSADQYFRNQISGAMSVSFAYKIPMLIHKAYSHIEEMNTASFYYDFNDFDKVLLRSKEELGLKVDEMNAYETYSKAYQEKRFADFIFRS